MNEITIHKYFYGNIFNEKLTFKWCGFFCVLYYTLCREFIAHDLISDSVCLKMDNKGIPYKIGMFDIE